MVGFTSLFPLHRSCTAWHLPEAMEGQGSYILRDHDPPDLFRAHQEWIQSLHTGPVQDIFSDDGQPEANKGTATAKSFALTAVEYFFPAQHRHVPGFAAAAL